MSNSNSHDRANAKLKGKKKTTSNKRLKNKTNKKKIGIKRYLVKFDIKTNEVYSVKCKAENENAKCYKLNDILVHFKYYVYLCKYVWHFLFFLKF